MKVKDFLEKKGIKVEYDGGYFYICSYKGNNIQIRHNDANINQTYMLYVNGKVVITRALITTCVGKILNLKESE